MRHILLPFVAVLGLSAASVRAQAQDDVRGLPLTEVRARTAGEHLAIVLSGDGGWADIDREIGKALADRGVNVIGFDTRKYLMTGRRNPDETAADVSRVARHYMREWGSARFFIVGYSRGAAFAPFVATRLAPDLRSHLSLLALLGLPEHASYTYHFSDLWSTRTNAKDLPILPELEKLRGARMMCVYGAKEDESLCRSIDSTLVRPFARDGGHHFDGDYRAITEQILSRLAAP